jgi:hypothetical protein
MLEIAKESTPLLKRAALQIHLNMDTLPHLSQVYKYSITLYQLDAEGDKVLIGDDEDLYLVLRQQKRRVENGEHPPLVRIVAVVKPVINESSTKG